MAGAETRLENSNVPLAGRGEFSQTEILGEPTEILGELTDNAKSLGRELTFSNTLPVAETEACWMQYNCQSLY